MEKNKKNILTMIMIITLSILTLISSTYASSCTEDTQCSDGDSKTFDKCVDDIWGGGKYCTNYGYYDNLNCKYDSQCNDNNPDTEDSCESGNPLDTDSYFSGKSCKHFLGNVYAGTLGSKTCDDDYSLTIDSKFTPQQAGGSYFCKYELKATVCTEHTQCDDNNEFTLDLCKMNHNIDTYVCENIQNGCLSDVDCSDDDIETADYCNLGLNSCSAHNSNILSKQGNGFNTYLSYVNIINVIGHLNNGETENFNINVETGEVKDGLNSNALIGFEIYEDTFKIERDNIGWRTTSENINTYNPDRIDTDMFLFQTLFANERKDYLTPNNAKCSFHKLNVGDWESIINPASNWKEVAIGNKVLVTAKAKVANSKLYVAEEKKIMAN